MSVITREDVARVRDRMRRYAREDLATAAELTQGGPSRQALEAQAWQASFDADALDRLLGEDTRPEPTHR